MCSSSKPKGQPPPSPPPPEPPTELVLDEAGDARRNQRSKAKSLKKGRRGLRIDLSTASRGGTGLRLSV
jgi:hypothetical protein